MGRVAPAEIAWQIGGLDRPVAGAWRAVRATAKAIARGAAIDGTGSQKRADFKMQVARRRVAALQHHPNLRAACYLRAILDVQTRIEVSIHRIQVARVT